MDGWSIFSNYLVYIPTLIFGLISIYGNLKLYKLKHHDFMKKRHLMVVFALNITYIVAPITVCICREAAILATHDSAVITGLTVGFTVFIWWLLLCLLNIQNWLLFFYNRWLYYLQQSEWQYIINPQLTDLKKKKNWYMRHKNSFGDFSYVCKLYISLHFILMIICIFGIESRILSGSFSHVQTSNNLIVAVGTVSMVISLLIAVLHYVITTVKTPYIKDPYSIHWITKIIAKLMTSFFGLILLMNLGIHFIGADLEIISAFMVIAVSVIFFVLSYFSTFGLIKRQFDGEAMMNGNVNKSYKHSLERIVSNKQALNLFMNHVSKEFSTECLLSYIEFSQFEQYLMTEIAKQKENIPQEKLHHFVPIVIQPSNVPKSGILTEDNESNESEIEMKEERKEALRSAKLKAHKLYMKYIQEGSEYEINISGSMRNQISDILENEHELLQNDTVSFTDLTLLFEKARSEMQQLLNFSLTRFQGSEDYGKMFDYLPVESEAQSSTKDTIIVYSQQR